MPTATVSRQRRARPRGDRIATDEPPPYSVRRFTVDEYHKLIDAGFFAENESFELLDGWIVPKMTRKPPHDVCIDLLTEVFGRVLPTGWRPRIQLAITLSTSVPEPDCAIVRGSARDYLDHHPRPDDIALVIEVSDDSLRRDRRKAAIYARDRLPRYWLINLIDGVIEDHSSPTGEGDAARYKSVKTIKPGGRLSLNLSGKVIELAVDELLP
jgi:Uma2 family endonuclease